MQGVLSFDSESAALSCSGANGSEYGGGSKPRMPTAEEAHGFIVRRVFVSMGLFFLDVPRIASIVFDFHASFVNAF